MHHNPCFNLFIIHNNSFDNQGSEINKNDIFLRFDILSFTKTLFLLYIYIIYNIKTEKMSFLNFNGEPEICLSKNRIELIIKYRKIVMQKLSIFCVSINVDPEKWLKFG